MSSNALPKSKSSAIRLRAACNECNSAKVKCTGEASQCQRCRSVGLTCVYAESRVGKVPGVRAKKKRLPNGPQASITAALDVGANHHSSTSTALETTTTEGTTTSISSVDKENTAPEPRRPVASTPPSSMQGPFDDTLAGWTSELDDTYNPDILSFNDVAFDPLQDTSEQDRNAQNDGNSSSSGGYAPITSEDSQFSLSDQVTASDFDFSIDQASNRYSSNVSGNLPVQNQTGVEPCANISSSATQKSYKELDSHCVLACTQIISHLETYILADLKTLDLSLSIVRDTLTEIGRLVDTQRASRNFRCMALFSVVMYQIIELLEAGCDTFLSETKENPADGLPGWLRHGSAASFGFGAFRMGAKEQRAWRADIVLKELSKSSEILQKIITLARLGPRQVCNGNPDDRAACYSDLERRLVALREKIGQRR